MGFEQRAGGLAKVAGEIEWDLVGFILLESGESQEPSVALPHAGCGATEVPHERRDKPFGIRWIELLCSYYDLIERTKQVVSNTFD